MSKLEAVTKKKVSKKREKKEKKEEILNILPEEEEKKEDEQRDLVQEQIIIDEGILLIRRDGVLKQVKYGDIKKELARNNWDYRLVTPDEKIMLIDYDKDLARPYIKALLAKVNKLREVKLLYFVILLLLVQMIAGSLIFIIGMYKTTDLQKSILKIPTSAPVSNVKKETQDFSPLDMTRSEQMRLKLKESETTNTGEIRSDNLFN